LSMHKDSLTGEDSVGIVGAVFAGVGSSPPPPHDHKLMLNAVIHKRFLIVVIA
jgi:hypothetical protein